MKNNSLIYFDSLDNIVQEIANIYDAVAEEMIGVNPMFYDKEFLGKTLFEFHCLYETNEKGYGYDLSLDMLYKFKNILSLIEMGTLKEFRDIFVKVKEKVNSDEIFVKHYYFNGLDGLTVIGTLIDKTIAYVEVVEKIVKGMQYADK